MQKYNIQETAIKELYFIKPFIASDNRGNFVKDYSQELLENSGIKFNLKEVFYTHSKKGVVRALHFQRNFQQRKLVHCLSGAIFDVVVDLRKGSSTFKKWVSFDLTGENHDAILIPGGCAHGYLVLEPSIVTYKCDEKFYSEYDDGIIWNDAEIGIDWPVDKVDGNIILSDKDSRLQSFRSFYNEFGGLV